MAYLQYKFNYYCIDVPYHKRLTQIRLYRETV